MVSQSRYHRSEKLDAMAGDIGLFDVCWRPDPLRGTVPPRQASVTAASRFAANPRAHLIHVLIADGPGTSKSFGLQPHNVPAERRRADIYPRRVVRPEDHPYVTRLAAEESEWWLSTRRPT